MGKVHVGDTLSYNKVEINAGEARKTIATLLRKIL